jgi:predicted PurR-regulated permease PerM
MATLTARGPDSVVALMQKMADLIEGARGHLPAWAQDYVPGTAEELQASASAWLRTHAGELRSFGENFGRGLVHVVVGIIIGSLVAFSRAPISAVHQPLAAALLARTTQLGQSFRRLVFAQIRISALNTLLTGLYLAVLLPLCGVQLPLIKTMIAVTFILGLLPLVGNLLSNTVIVVVALSHSLGAAAGSLAYLVTIHKLEYFVNAQIIGTQMRARAWELLTAMLVMEAVFGLPGLVAAPIYYGYLKSELAAKRLV